MKIDNVLDMLVLADLLKAVAVVKSVAVAMKFMLENAMVLVSQDAENLKKNWENIRIFSWNVCGGNELQQLKKMMKYHLRRIYIYIQVKSKIKVDQLSLL